MGLLQLILAVTVSWNCVTEDINGGPEVIDRYCVFWSETSHDQGNANMVCAEFRDCYWTLAEDNFLFNTPYYFSVTAVDIGDNESEFSDEAIYIREQPPFGGGGRRIRKHLQRMIYVPWR